MLKPGYYTGRILNYGMRKTKDAGVLSPTIAFQVTDEEGKPITVYWQKSLTSAKSTATTLEELIVCGLRSSEEFAALADGPDSNTLDLNKDVQLTVEHNTYNGKTSPRVAWINAPRSEGQSQDQNGISRDETERLLATIDLTGAFEAAFAKVNKHNVVETPSIF